MQQGVILVVKGWKGVGLTEKNTIAMTEAFAGRKNRFLMLNNGVEAAGWRGKPLELLEVGCNRGDAAAYLTRREPFRVTAVDLDGGMTAEARRLHGEDERLRYLCANAEDLPFTNASFDGIYSEAAFSVLASKRRVISEYARVLRPGGRVLINDFTITGSPKEGERAEVSAIPCLRGVLSLREYSGLFSEVGFVPVCAEENFAEFLRIVMWLCKVYGVGADALGSRLAGFLGPDCGAMPSEATGRDFFRSAGLTYCCMVFEKREQL